MIWYILLATVAYFLWKYSVAIISKVLSIATKCKIRVGGVGFFEIREVNVRLPQGLAVHVDMCCIQRDSHSSRLFVIRMGDVRIEGEPRVLARRKSDFGGGDGSSRETTNAWIRRCSQLAQYFGLFVNRVHLVLLEVVPECMVHVTVDELSIETFRSREGWQLETTCRLIQGKTLRRSGPSGRLLTEVSFPLHLSIDIVASRLNKIVLRVADPCISVTNGLFDIIKEFMQRKAVVESAQNGTAKEPHEFEPRLFSINWQLLLSVDIQGATLKYTGTCQEECRYATLSIHEVNVGKFEDNFQLKLSGFALSDQLQKSALRTSFLSISISKAKDAGFAQVRFSSDSVQTMLSLHDALWWRNHVDFLAQNFANRAENEATTPKSESPGASKMPKIGCILEIASVSCDLLDFENLQSTLSVEFLSFVKHEEGWEIGVESLSFFSAPSRATNWYTNMSFEQHQWGHSIHVGVALLQWNTTNSVPLMTVGIDDVKVEWSERLSKQLNDVISITTSGTPKKSSQQKKPSPLALRLTTNRAVLISVAHETSFVALLADKVDAQAADVTQSVSTVVQGLRAVVCSMKGFFLDVKALRSATRVQLASQDSRESSPSRRWSQSEKDRSNVEQKQKQIDELEKDMRLCASADEIRLVINYRSPVINEVRLFFSCDVFVSWSPLLHLLILHLRNSTNQAFTPPTRNGVMRRKVPRKLHLYVSATQAVEIELELARTNRMAWKCDTFSLQLIEGQLTTSSKRLCISMNSFCIVTATNVIICSRPSDETMTSSRISFATLHSETNKVWTWSAELFHFHLPFEFNFAAVFDEFVSMFKWLKLVHEVKKKSFTAESPLPSDVRIDFKEVIFELDDDPFENHLQSSYELKEDEVYECERRNQILEERLIALKKTIPLLSKEMIDEVTANLVSKNSEIYIERWNRAEFTPRPLFVSKWIGWSMRAFADLTLHGTDKCIELMRLFDPLSNFPDDIQFSTLWARAVEFDIEQWTVNFKDYPMKYLDAKELHFFGILVGAEAFQEGGRSLRECTISVPKPWTTHVVQRNMSPLKFYYDIQCASSEFTAKYGPCWEPCLSMISLTWNNISSPSRDPSPPLPFWDKMRLLLHGRLLWSSDKMVTTMLASTDPYNQTETVEWCWDDFGLDWALGEVRIKSGLRIFMHTASRYDDSRVLMLPDVRMKILLGWVCNGDPHDHHSVVYCSPQRLPHYSSVDQHDSFRSFRSSSVNVTLNFDVSPGVCTSAEKMPNVLLYANTFRCVEQLLKTLMTKNRNVRRGKIFGNCAMLKPQLSKHFGKMQVSVTLPKFFVTYWMSHSSAFGFRLFSDGLQMTASFRQSVQHSSINGEMNVRRRKVYSWEVQHMTCTLWATQVHVYGEGVAPPEDGVPKEDTFLLGVSRVQYAREAYFGKDMPVHKLTAYDVKMSWTAENRNACLMIADGVHRAHMLRRILSNDAVKILNVHLEEDESRKEKKAAEKKESEEANKNHRRGYSMSDANQWMLTQLIDEVGTKLVAHCEQPTDVPIDSLVGVQQCTADDIKLLNWQIDLFNSQLVLQGCQTDGFLHVTAAKAQLIQNVHRGVWKGGLLLSKKSWTAMLSGMQYFAPISMTGENKTQFRWLPKEVIDERSQEAGLANEFVQKFSTSGEAVGGTVQPETSSGNNEEIGKQLQRLVSRCSCQIYFCYFSDELKTDAGEEIAVPKMEKENRMMNLDEIGVDCLTLKHNMLEATSNSQQYEMMVDIINNLVLFVDPVKKEMAEKRRRLRFQCQIMDMQQLRNNIIRYQSDLREIVSFVRSRERQIFYLHHEQDGQNGRFRADESMTSSQTDGPQGEELRLQIESETEEGKQLMLVVSDQLATYISCYKQRQVSASRAEVQEVESDSSAPLVRRFEVCFEDCIWKLKEKDGQIVFAETQIRNFLYTRTIRMENSGEHLFEVGSIRVTNMLPNTVYKHTLHRDDPESSRQPAIRLFVRDMPPVGGICVKEHFELNVSPMVAEITHRFFDKMMVFFFPGRIIHNQEALESNDSEISKFSFTRRIANTLSMRSQKSQNDKKTSTLGKVSESEKDDIDRMRERADQINHFLYIKIPEVSFVVSYKGNKDKNLTDVNKFNFLFPLCEFHEKNWTWLDLALAVKQRCKRVLLQQFMRQKLLRNRLTGLAIDQPLQGISEEEKKRIAIGTATGTLEKKRKK